MGHDALVVTEQHLKKEHKDRTRDNETQDRRTVRHMQNSGLANDIVNDALTDISVTSLRERTYRL